MKPTNSAKRPKTQVRRTRDFAPWSASNGSYVTGAAMIDEVDKVIGEMEKHWGADRLRLLVDVGLREKFDRQRALWNRAIWQGTLDELQTEARRTQTAWRACDKAARAAGKEPTPPTVWETALADGRVLAVVRSNADTRDVKPDGRATMVVSLEEVANMVAAFPALVAEIKTKFPGAAVTRTRATIEDPLGGMPHPGGPLDDEIPF